MNSANLLSDYERCARRGFWSRSWQRHRLTSMEMLHSAVRSGLTESVRSDFGEVAGEHLMSLAENRGLDNVQGCHVYDCAIHHAALADIVVTGIRKPQESPWEPATPDTTPDTTPWVSGAYLDPSGAALRGILMVSSWSEERRNSAVRTWSTLGEVCQFGLPMRLAVAVVGSMISGRRRSPFSKGLLHPINRSLRFQRRSKGWTNGFRETWQPIWREDHAEIERQAWLQAMLEDEVLQDHLFVVDVAVPGEVERSRIRDMAARNLESLAGLKALPDAKLEVCHDPIHACPFIWCCHNPEGPVSPEDSGGYDAPNSAERRDLVS